MSTFNQDHIKQFRFKQLFNELGWDLPAQQQAARDFWPGHTGRIQAIAQLGGARRACGFAYRLAPDGKLYQARTAGRAG